MEFEFKLKDKFTSDSLITVIAIVITGLCGLLINYIIQKYFNSDGLGVFSYIISIFLIVNSISTLGMNRAMVFFTSFYSDNIEKRNQLIINAFFLVTCWSFLLFLILNFGLYFLDSFFTKDQQVYLKIVTLAVPFYSINNVGIAVLNGVRRMKFYSFIRSFRWISLVALLIYISISNPLKYTFYSFLISESLVFLIIFYSFLRSKYLNGTVRLYSIFLILDYIKYVYPSQIIVSFNENIDIIILENFISEGSLGVYSFSSKVAKALILVGVAIQTNFNPIVSSYYKNNFIDKLKNFCLKLRNASFRVFSPMILLTILLYFILVNSFIAENIYLDNFYNFILQAIFAGLYASFVWSGGILIMTGKIKQNVMRGLVKLIAITLLTYFCVIIFPIKYGIYIGFSLMMISQLFIDRFFIYKYVGIKIF